MSATDPLLGKDGSSQARPFGNDSPPFAGLRVIDFSTVAAAPAVAQVFALNGADVIKVESKEGCMSRGILKQYMPARGGKGMHSTTFDMLNRNKESLVLDLKKPSHLTVLGNLLESADVFITNMRLEALRRLGLDYQSLCPLYKHLVYVHLSAFGLSGPLKNRMGYDATAFWAGTGMARLFVEPGHMVDYPVAFGDLNASAVLFTGAVVALLKRCSAGSGACVETSLYETGLWAMAPYFDSAPVPEPNLANRHYDTRDGTVAVCHPLDEKADALLVEAVGATDATVAAVEERCVLMSSAELISALAAKELVYSECQSLVHLLLPGSSGPPWASKVQRDLAPDLKYVPNPSFSLRSTSEPVMQTPGVKLGSLNSKIPKDLNLAGSKLWKDVPEDYLIKPPHNSGHSKPLKQLTVVEYSTSTSSAVSGACAMFAELGFPVHRVITPESERLAALGGEQFSRHLHGLKTVSDLQQALRAASLLVTDASEEKLKAAGVVVPQTCSVVYFDVMKGALGSWLMSTGITTTFRSPTSSGTWSKLKQVPFQSVDLMAGFHVAMAMATALFHARRSGKAQVANLDIERVGLWQLPFFLGIVQGVPEFLKYHDPTSNITWQQKMDERPLASLCNPRLKDQRWVLMFGANLKHDLPAVLKAFRIRDQVYPWCCCSIAQACCCSCGKSKSEKVQLVMKPINIAVKSALEALTSEEFETIMAANKLGFYIFEAAPEEARTQEQALALGTFCSDKGFRVRSPLRMNFVLK